MELPPESGRGTGPATDADELRLEVMLAAAETGVDLDYEVVRSSLEDFDPSVVLRGGDTGAGEGAAGGEVGAQEARAGGGGSGRAQRGEALVVCLSTHLDTLPDSTVLRSNPRDRFLKVSAPGRGGVTPMPVSRQGSRQSFIPSGRASAQSRVPADCALPEYRLHCILPTYRLYCRLYLFSPVLPVMRCKPPPWSTHVSVASSVPAVCLVSPFPSLDPLNPSLCWPLVH